MKTFRKNLWLSSLLASLILVPAAAAHRPEKALPGAITPIPDATTSFAYYQELETAVQVDIYQVQAEAGQFFHAGINIPQIDGLENYGVSLALLGPGLPGVDLADLPALNGGQSQFETEDSARSDALLALLGLEKATGIIQENQIGDPFYEPFTQTNYWGRQVLELTFPESGNYFLVVWQAEGQPGKYVMDTGREEVFGPADLFRFPVWWVNTRIYFEQTPYLLAGLGGMLAAFAFVFLFVRSRQMETAVLPMQK